MAGPSYVTSQRHQCSNPNNSKLPLSQTCAQAKTNCRDGFDQKTARKGSETRTTVASVGASHSLWCGCVSLNSHGTEWRA